MLRFRLRRPSPALVVAFLALLIALGGTGVAATSYISAKNIKKNSIPGDRLKNDTVTGKQVKESSLGKVPSAKLADTATSATSATSAANATNAVNATNAANATNAQKAVTATSAGKADTATSAATAQNADTVGGVDVEQYAVKVASDGPAATVVEGAGASIRLSCPAGEPLVTGTNLSGADNMLIRGTFTSPYSTTPPPYGYDTTGASNLDNGNATTLFNGGLHGRGTLTVAVARDGGPSMTVVMALDDPNTYGNFDGCSAVGNATASG